MLVKLPLLKSSVLKKHHNIFFILLESNLVQKLSYIKIKLIDSNSGILVPFYIIIAGDPKYHYLAL